jgi:hypothetical protein
VHLGCGVDALDVDLGDRFPVRPRVRQQEALRFTSSQTMATSPGPACTISKRFALTAGCALANSSALSAAAIGSTA